MRACGQEGRRLLIWSARSISCFILRNGRRGSAPGGSDRRGFLPGPIQEYRALREPGRQAIALLVRKRSRLGLRRGETAMSIVGPIRAVIPIILERDEWARSGALFERRQSLVAHWMDDTRATVSVSRSAAISAERFV